MSDEPTSYERTLFVAPAYADMSLTYGDCVFLKAGFTRRRSHDAVHTTRRSHHPRFKASIAFIYLFCVFSFIIPPSLAATCL